MRYLEDPSISLIFAHFEAVIETETGGSLLRGGWSKLDQKQVLAHSMKTTGLKQKFMVVAAQRLINVLFLQRQFFKVLISKFS